MHNERTAFLSVLMICITVFILELQFHIYFFGVFYWLGAAQHSAALCALCLDAIVRSNLVLSQYRQN